MVQKNKLIKYMFENNIISLNFQKLFVYSSGLKSPIYIDNRLFLSDYVALKLLINEWVKFIKKNYPNATKLCGVLTSGLPFAAILSYELQKPLIYLRNEQKQYGKQKLIEGKILSTDKILIIEDLITTGKSSLKIANKLIEKKFNVIGISSIYSYELINEVKKNNLHNISINYLINFNDLKTYLKDKNIINKLNLTTLESFWNKLNNII